MTGTDKLVIGNWKMNGSLKLCREFFSAFKTRSKEKSVSAVGLALPYPYLLAARGDIERLGWALGSEDVSRYPDFGAYTGEVSAAMLADLGVTFSLVGHSERRLYYGEEAAAIKAKLTHLIAAGITPVLCVGESAEEKKEGLTQMTLEAQIDVLSGLKISHLAVAYEPLWAIGSGVTPTAHEIETCGGWILRRILSSHPEAAKIHFLYGGSVTGDNAGLLARIPSLNGVLVGGGSLDAAQFNAVIAAFAN